MGVIRATAAAVLILTAVAAAGDCVTMAQPISTRASNPNLVAGPVAWSGSVLGVAKTQSGVANALWFAVYGEDLQTLVGDRLIASDSREIINLVWTGTEFGLFYRANNQRLHLQRLSMMGDSIGGPIAVTPGTVSPGDEIDVEWSPALDAYVVARFISQGTLRGRPQVTVVNRDGTQRSDRVFPVFAVSNSNLSLSVTETGIIGMFFVGAGGQLSFGIIETDSMDVRAVSQAPGDFVESAAIGNNFVVVHAVENGLITEIRWLVVDTSHQVIRTDQLLLQGSGDNAWPLALVSANGELAMAYINNPDNEDLLDKTYRLRRFTLGGTTLSDTRFAAADIGASRAESVYDFVWSGTSYLQAAVRDTPDRLNSYLLRLCPLDAEIIAEPARARPGEPVVFTALPEGGVPSYSYAWTFGDPQRVFRTQVVTRTYEDTGSYIAMLTVTDTAGATVTKTYIINVTNPRRRGVRP